LDYEKALQARGSDPLTLAVKTRVDLERWAEWLDGKKVSRSGILKGVVGWVLVFEVRLKAGRCPTERNTDGW